MHANRPQPRSAGLAASLIRRVTLAGVLFGNGTFQPARSY
jgi:hypothetical protein